MKRTAASMSAGEILDAIQLERYDLAPLNIPNMPRFIDIVRDALSGQLDLTPTGLINAFANVIFGEFMANGQLIRQLLVIAIIGALMSVLTEAFKHKSAGETGFYATFLMTAAIAVSSFYIAVDVLTRLISTITVIMQASLPLMVGVLMMGGNFVGAAGFNSVLFFALQFLARFIASVFVPLILAAAAVDIASKLSSDGERLDKLAELVRKIADWTLKGILAMFAFLLTLQRFTAPIVNNVAIRTSRNVVGAVPVVGNALTAAMDTVVSFSQAARSGVLVAMVLVLCATLAGPVIKIFALSFMYKAIAALIQPVADKRLTTLMDSIGKHLSMLFTAAVLIGVMCIYVVIILLSL